MIAKLESAAGDAADSHRKVTVAIEGAHQLTDPVRRALAERRRVRLRYYVPARDEVTERDVDPMRLLVAGGQTYLEGWCLTADDLRIFRLDRIESLDVLDTSSRRATRPRRPRPVAGHLRPRGGAVGGTSAAAPPRPMAARHVSGHRRRPRNRRSRSSTFRSPTSGWARQLVLRLGGDAEPLAPIELVDAVRDETDTRPRGVRRPLALSGDAPGRSRSRLRPPMPKPLSQEGRYES